MILRNPQHNLLGLKINSLLFLLFTPFYLNTSFASNRHIQASNILIFTSFSMPKNSLRGWINEANTIHAPIIMRGLVNHSFRETTRKVMEVLPNNQGGIQIDPTLFKKFRINQVPAVVVSKANCLKTEFCEDYDVIYGDVTLEYALTKISEQSGVVSDYVKEALIILKGRHRA
jgi:conjugal transfer pilus assembly protein TrbC